MRIAGAFPARSVTYSIGVNLVAWLVSLMILFDGDVRECLYAYVCISPKPSLTMQSFATYNACIQHIVTRSRRSETATVDSNMVIMMDPCESAVRMQNEISMLAYRVKLGA